jgi:hypothetical protein
MKKRLFFLPMVAIMMAACSSNETIEVNENKGDLISFRPIVKGVTRAADADLSSDGTSFNVEAFNTGTTSSPYFSNVTFTKSGDTFTSATKYYWPTNNLDFYAYSPITEDVSGVQKGALSNEAYQIVKTDYKTFIITPSNTVSEQVDFIYANTNNKGKGSTGEVTTLNFRHAGAKISVKVKNSAPNLKFEISGWKLGFLDNTATFTYAYASTGTDTPNAQLAFSDWSENSTQSADNTYSTTFTANPIAASQSTAYFLGNTGTPSASTDESINMILIPQTLSAATAYADATAGAKPNGSYIALKMVIKNNTTAGETVADATANDKWAMWPIGGYNWEPGKKYTYTIDLAGGGYYETNQDADTDLDPILEGAEIKFATVSIDGWAEMSRTADDVYLSHLKKLANNGTDCSSYLGWIISSDGCIYANKAAVEAAGKTGVAMICYIGAADTADSSPGAGSYNGLAIALSDIGGAWCDHPSEQCLPTIFPDPTSGHSDMKGIQNTKDLQNHSTHTHDAANAVRTFPVMPPSDTSGWFIPSYGQLWKYLQWCGITSGYQSGGATLLNNKYEESGYSEAKFSGNNYFWTSTEVVYEEGDIRNYVLNIDNGSSKHINLFENTKDYTEYIIRPFVAF